ncbi:MAG: NAD-dependent epimerase/dehydratase family protein [Polyangiaceae bacterium]|nr:NAD-dependent epimerase/dehydratase family protein [Polyangiaceae bacterium]
MHLAFIGGTRFIGRAAVRRALEVGHRVSVFHRGEHPCDVAGAVDVLVDRQDPSALCAALARAAPNALIDTRAMTRADAQVTVLAARLLGVPAVVLSSADVYAQFGRLNGHPAPEPEDCVVESSALTVPYPFRGLPGDHPPDYDKKDVEHELEQAGVPALVLRLPAVYGSGDHRRRFGGVVDRLDAGQRVLPLQGGGTFRHSHAHVEDVAHAMVLGAERWREGFAAMNVAEQTTPTMRERVDAIASCMGVGLEWQEEPGELPPDLAFLGRMPNDVVLGTALIRRRLGFDEVTTSDQRVRDLVTGLRKSRAAPG